jgi:hypothetical protein
MTQNKKETIFKSAVAAWWDTKEKNVKDIRSPQGGTRDASLRGDTMDGFREVVVNALIDLGVEDTDIFYGNHFSPKPATLPSYYRASKNWDIVVCKNSRHKATNKEPVLIAAIEFKSQHKSIGKNQNNRIEESIGNATDFWASHENGNFGSCASRPWLGYLFVGMYADADVDRGVEITLPHFRSDEAFNPCDDLFQSNTTQIGPSYARRYRIFLERMIEKRQYNGAAFIVTNESIKGEDENYVCLFPEISGACFMASLIAHVTTNYFDTP